MPSSCTNDLFLESSTLDPVDLDLDLDLDLRLRLQFMPVYPTLELAPQTLKILHSRFSRTAHINQLTLISL